MNKFTKILYVIYKLITIKMCITLSSLISSVHSMTTHLQGLLHYVFGVLFGKSRRVNAKCLMKGGQYVKHASHVLAKRRDKPS